MKIRNLGGFTLIETLIVVALIAVLTVIAYPSYTAHVIKSNRTAAQTELLELASLQEKIYLNSNAYATNMATAYTGKSDGGLGRTTNKSNDGKYDLRFVSNTAQSYEIQASPVAGTMQVGDGSFSITSTGTRTCAAPIPTWCKNGVW